MVKVFVDAIYREFKIRGAKERFTNKEKSEYLKILDDILIEMNITKCHVRDLDNEFPGSSSYLIYLLQANEGIDFGLCQYYKTWFNEKGMQRRCQFNKGPIQVNCYGKITKCENMKKYSNAKK